MEHHYILTKKIEKNENNAMKKRKLDEIIFTRACSCIGIAIYHYFCHSKGNFKFLYNTANASFGFIFVTVFFNISGATLYYNYPLIKSIKTFYFKRWKSIFPSFYFCYLYFFISISLRFRRLLFGRKIKRLFITLLGLDGYLSYRIRTCYLIGEWFLGAIIIIYVIYPIFSLIVTKNYFISAIIICILNIFIYYGNFFIIINDKNIITCLTSFYFGVTAIKFKKIFLVNNISLAISFFLFIFLRIIKIKSLEIVFQMQGFTAFIILTRIGKIVMTNKCARIFICISNLSYNIYLIHHMIIIDILSINNPLEWYSNLLFLSITLLLIIICSKIVSILVNSILNSIIFKKMESFFI